MQKLYLVVSMAMVFILMNKHEPGVAGVSAGSGGQAGTIKASLMRLPTGLKKGYQLSRSDDFDGTSLDSSLWQYYEENKLRGYAKVLKSNVAVFDGTLKLYARKSVDASGNLSYSTSMISTMQHFNQKYGYFEVRAKVNKQVGPHCSFWLLQHSVGVVNSKPNPAVFGAEIDVFEYLPASFDNLTFGLHWNGYMFTNGSHQQLIQTVPVPGISQGFHNFALEWTPREYIIYVDGIEKARTSTAISHIPQFLILSTEIVGYGGDPAGMDPLLADVFEVDYLNVYKRLPAVNLYGEQDFSGWISDDLRPGEYTTADLEKHSIADNDASSIEVPEGWTVIAYEQDHFMGKSITINADKRYAGSFDNKLSSLKIIRKHEKIKR